MNINNGVSQTDYKLEEFQTAMRRLLCFLWDLNQRNEYEYTWYWKGGSQD